MDKVNIVPTPFSFIRFFRELESTTQIEMEDYVVPQIEVIEIEAEQCFATSDPNGTGDGWGGLN